jgi:hypothetical protein
MRLYLAILAVILVLLVGILPSGRWDWYLTYPYFDKFMHLLGGFVIAWLLGHILERDLRAASWWGAAIMLVGATAIVGIAWEAAEYLSGVYLVDATEGWKALVWQYFHGGDLKDTLLDLGADIVGALALCALYEPLVRRKGS